MTDSCYLALQEQCPFQCIIAISQPWEFILLYISSAHLCLTFIVIVPRLWLILLGFQLLHPRLRGLKGFSVDAHQLKRQSDRCYTGTRDSRGRWPYCESLVLPRRLRQVSWSVSATSWCRRRQPSPAFRASGTPAQRSHRRLKKYRGTNIQILVSSRFSLSFGSKMVTSMSILEHDW